MNNELENIKANVLKKINDAKEKDLDKLFYNICRSFHQISNPSVLNPNGGYNKLINPNIDVVSVKEIPENASKNFKTKETIFKIKGNEYKIEEDILPNYKSKKRLYLNSKISFVVTFCLKPNTDFSFHKFTREREGWDTEIEVFTNEEWVNDFKKILDDFEISAEEVRGRKEKFHIDALKENFNL